MENETNKGNPAEIKCEVRAETARSVSKREKKKERSRKRMQAVSCALGIALVFDILIFLIAILSSAWDVGAYAFLAVFVIVPPMVWCMPANFEESSLPSWWYRGD